MKILKYSILISLVFVFIISCRQTNDNPIGIDIRLPGKGQDTTSNGALTIEPSVLNGTINVGYILNAVCDNPPISSRYEWDFGDGSAVQIIKNNNIVTQTYKNVGTYTVKCILYDDNINTKIAEATSQVNILDSLSVVFDNGNISGVSNGPPNPTIITTTRTYLITYILTYHWNSGQGKLPDATNGFISLKAEDGTILGPWKVAKTTLGQGGVPNANWITYPNYLLPAGTYEVIDGDPSSWSHNSQSNNCGFAHIDGIAK